MRVRASSSGTIRRGLGEDTAHRHTALTQIRQCPVQQASMPPGLEDPSMGLTLSTVALERSEEGVSLVSIQKGTSSSSFYQKYKTTEDTFQVGLSQLGRKRSTHTLKDRTCPSDSYRRRNQEGPPSQCRGGPVVKHGKFYTLQGTMKSCTP